jgi:hypothetical protein
VRKTQRLATIQAKLDVQSSSHQQMEQQIPILLMKKVFYFNIIILTTKKLIFYLFVNIITNITLRLINFMNLFPNLRIPNLENKFEYKIVSEFVQSFHGFDINKITKVQALPGPKGEFGQCSKHCKEKVKQYGGEVIYGIIIDIDDNIIYATFHCVWKYNNKLLDVTKPEYGHDHQKHGVLFIPATKPQHFIIRKVDSKDFYFFPNPIIHFYTKSKYSNMMLPIFKQCNCFQIV